MIRKSLCVAAVVAIFMINGCSSPKAKAENDKREVSIPKKLSSKKIQSVIVKAGEKKGWIMTPLTSFSIVASKYIDGKSASVVIDYNTENVSIEKNRTTMSDSAFTEEVEELKKAIVDSF